MLLDDDLKPIIQNQQIYTLLNDNHYSIQYQTIYNISTTTNIGYIQSRIVIDIQLILDTPLKYEQGIQQLFNQQNFSQFYCTSLSLDNQTYICNMDLIAQQQNFIEIVIQLGLNFQIRNLQIYILKCTQNCALCKLQTNQCLKCEDQYKLTQESCRRIYNTNYNITELTYTLNYLGNQYIGYLQFVNQNNLLTISTGDVKNIILDYNTTNKTKEIIIDNNIQIGPFIQNEGIQYYNFNLNIHEPIHIKIDYTIYILYDDDYLLSILYYSINGYEKDIYLSHNFLDGQEDCYTPSYQNCKICKFYNLYYNVTQIDNLKIQGGFPLQLQNVAWALGNIKVTQIQNLKCQYKIHKQSCLKQCPLGTIDDNNVCLDKIQERFVVLHNFKFIKKFDILTNNHFYLEIYQPYFKYENSIYELINRNLQIEIKMKKKLQIYFKLIIIDANVNEQIIVNLFNYSLTFNVTDMKPLINIIGSEELNDYAFEFQNKSFEFQNVKGLSKLQIIRKGCQQEQCSLLISELLIVSPKCTHDCEECNEESSCTIQENIQCPQYYYYSNFECRQCKQNCIKCNYFEQCLECEEGFFLFSGECYQHNKLKYQITRPFKIKLKESIYNSQSILTNCDDEYQIRNVEFCVCQNGYIFNQEYQCIPCREQCLTCIRSINHCQSCRSTENRRLESGQCICQEGYYEQNGNLQCKKCLQKCKQCQYKEFICTECYLSQHRVLNLNDCICQDGYYHDYINDICLQCKKTCKNCKDYDTCIDCDQLQFRILTFQNQCICQQGYFLNNEQCQSCHYTCLECQNSSEFNKCTKCTQDRKRKNIQMDYFECICQDGYYDIGQQQCYDCQLIDNPKIDHYCYTKCGDGIIQWNEECDNGIQIQRDGCHQCKLSQSKCQNEICQICYQKECVLCQDGYYLQSDYSCDKCSPICKTCKINPYNCIICAENNHQCSNCLPDKGYIYLENQCQNICGDGYITLEEECDDGNLIDNDGCNQNCQIEHFFVCGNTCINKPSWNIYISQNKLDKYYSNQRQFHITIQNYESNIEKEQFQLFYLNTQHNCGNLYYTIIKQSKVGFQQFIIKLNLYQSCIDQYLNLLLLNDSKIIYKKQIQILNYFTIQYQFIFDYLLQSFHLLLYAYSIIFMINFIFIQSYQYIEILFLFQIIAYQKHFLILTPKYFETFVQLFSPFQMIIFSQFDLQNNEQTQQKMNQSQIKDNIIRQLILIIILIVTTSILRLLIYILIRIKQNRSHQKIIQKLQKQITYQIVYFINYFNYSLYIWITLNQYSIQILLYIAFITIYHIKIQKYFRKQKSIRFIILLNTIYILILMMMINNQIFQLLLTSLIVGVQLILSIIQKNYFQLKYKLLLGNLWGTHFIYLIFELYTSTVQKYEQFNQILGGILIINYFVILLLYIFDILRNSFIIIKQQYQKFKDRYIVTHQDHQYFDMNIIPSLTQRIQR
ncbi:unnamed protein product [Paramecium pentaurelia]|uniref:EGF-like domain-containing protein n=1 Tax=Paramecium pentaurelia TaxID=43138 RepID=A0A8S1XT21_9CILI|nr:unnamed protein product [Paramecium pentaurelia]